MRTFLLAATIAGAAFLPTYQAGAVTMCDQNNMQCTPCDKDPLCGTGRGAIPGYVCWRNEVSPVNTGNGRVCENGHGHTGYVYTRGLCNRSVVEVYWDGTDVFAPDLPPHC